MKTYGGGGITPRTFDLGTRWMALKLLIISATLPGSLKKLEVLNEKLKPVLFRALIK